MRPSFMMIPLAAAVSLSACGPSQPKILAKVEAIQRNCGYTVTETKYRGSSKVGSSKRDAKMDCSEDFAFQQIKAGKSDKTLTGEADVFVRYQLPGDSSSHSARLKIPARNDLFYSLEVGQDLPVRIDPENSSNAYL